MALKGNYKGGGKDFEPITEGVHVGIIYGVVDVGTHTIEYQDKTVERQQLVIIWELPEERMQDGRPFSISKKYTKSLHEKASLRKDVEAISGRKLTEEDIETFNPADLVGSGCQLQVVHTEKNGKTYANIFAIMALPKSVKPAKPENPILIYEIEQPIPETMPKWLREMASRAKERDVIPDDEPVPATMPYDALEPF